MKNVTFEEKAFGQFLEWSDDNKKVFKKVSDLINDIQRHPFEGLGKPEPLKGNYKGYWSRRITEEHRLIYKVTDSLIIIASCKYHYEK